MLLQISAVNVVPIDDSDVFYSVTVGSPCEESLEPGNECQSVLTHFNFSRIIAVGRKIIPSSPIEVVNLESLLTSTSHFSSKQGARSKEHSKVVAKPFEGRQMIRSSSW